MQDLMQTDQNRLVSFHSNRKIRDSGDSPSMSAGAADWTRTFLLFRISQLVVRTVPSSEIAQTFLRKRFRRAMHSQSSGASFECRRGSVLILG